VGWLRFLDVLAFRAYYRLKLASGDRAWEIATLDRLSREYPQPSEPRTLITPTPNSPEAEAFIRSSNPDLIIARCKTLLASRIFTLARSGTFVMHPGICPEYRNAHGCFWALACGDRDNVGMTLLKIDKGIDTGPVYGYFRVEPRESESHIVMQHRTVFDNLPEIAATFESILNGTVQTIDTRGRRSAEWGQPWLTKYPAFKRTAQGKRSS
jgi:methionyl-tRNA formyltransferase